MKGDHGDLLATDQLAAVYAYSGPAETFAAQLPAYNAVLKSVVVR